MMQWGIINGACAGYDHLCALRFAAGRHPDYPHCGVDVVQAYLNPGDLADTSRLERIAQTAAVDGLGLITHLHTPFPEAASEEILRRHRLVLARQPFKRIVIHHASTPDHSRIIALCRRYDLIPYIENNHRGVDDPLQRKRHRAFVDDVAASPYPIGAVLDFGRYFIDAPEDVSARQAITRLILQTYRTLTARRIPLLFHTIGTRTYRQARKDWVAPGASADCIPHRELLQGILAVHPDEKGPLIVESESLPHAAQGIRNLQQMLEGYAGHGS